jgi:hypothetical protein
MLALCRSEVPMPTATLARVHHGVSSRLSRARTWIDQVGTLEWLASSMIRARRLATFKFVEVGVFKGDNAVSVIQTARQLQAEVAYIGFDLFENKDEFFASHPDDLAMYDLPEYEYFEFKSGAHAYHAVRMKLSAVLPEQEFTLIAGDSTKTVPAHLRDIADATIVYIDGCHDYDIVSQDWRHVRPLLDENPSLIVVFDDMTYSGVYRLMTEIRDHDDRCRVYILSYNQFAVASAGRLPLNEKLTLRGARLLTKCREVLSRQ